jgi:hypothetical protein
VKVKSIKRACGGREIEQEAGMIAICMIAGWLMCVLMAIHVDPLTRTADFLAAMLCFCTGLVISEIRKAGKAR